MLLRCRIGWAGVDGLASTCWGSCVMLDTWFGFSKAFKKGGDSEVRYALAVQSIAEW